MLTKLQLETFYRSFLQELCYNLYESPVLITKKDTEEQLSYQLQLIVGDEVIQTNVVADMTDSDKKTIRFKTPLEYSLAKIEVYHEMPNLLTVTFYQKNNNTDQKSAMTPTEMYFTDDNQAYENGFSLDKNILIGIYRPMEPFYYQMLEHHLDLLNNYAKLGDRNNLEEEKKAIASLHQLWIDDCKRKNEKVNEMRSIVSDHGKSMKRKQHVLS